MTKAQESKVRDLLKDWPHDRILELVYIFDMMANKEHSEYKKVISLLMKIAGH